MTLHLLGLAMLFASAPPTGAESPLAADHIAIPATSDDVVAAGSTPPDNGTDGAAATVPDGPDVPDVPPPESAEPAADDPGTQDILVTARAKSPADPLAEVNLQSYKAVQALDVALVAPLARTYKAVLPTPVRSGIHNFLLNVQQPIVFLNYLLQLKPGKAGETLGRFAINTTIGLGGVIDVAKKRPFNLPHRPNSLANTLGYYGVKPGPFLFVPLVGPTTIRDLFGITIDRLVLPMAVGKPFDQLYYTIPVNTLSALDYRVAFDDSLKEQREAENPYVATRENYLRSRKAEIDGLHSAAWRARQSAAEPAKSQ